MSAPSSPMATRGNRYADDSALWAVVKQSGASSKVEYDRWRDAQRNRASLPTYKTIQRTFRDRSKPGESAWTAMLRLGRKAGAL